MKKKEEKQGWETTGFERFKRIYAWVFLFTIFVLCPIVFAIFLYQLLH